MHLFSVYMLKKNSILHCIYRPLGLFIECLPSDWPSG